MKKKHVIRCLSRIAASELNLKRKLIFLFLILLLGVTSTQNSYSQDASSRKKKTISGSIKDETGETLPGVNVLIKGTTNGTISDMNGNYIISDVPVGSVLKFSFIGMATQEVVVGRELTIDVQMMPAAIGLDEVVAVGYGTQKKRDVTGAVASVSSEDIPKGLNKDVGSTLSGMTAGVNVIQSGGADPNALPKIRIRGSNSINLSSEPLYVVDGIPIDPEMNNTIDPSIIERIDILKDASAAAIYGIRGANGVILIKTKDAAETEGLIAYNSKFGIQKLIRPFEYAPASELAKIENEVAEAEGNDPIYSDEEIANMGDGYDYIDETFRTAFYQDHNLNFIKGNKKNQVFVSLGYTNQEGILKNTDFERYTFSVKTSSQLSKNFSIRNNIKTAFIDANYTNYSPGSSSESVMYNILQVNPLIPFYNEDGTYGEPPVGVAGTNPLPYLYDVEKNNKVYNVLLSTQLNYKLTKKIDVKLTGSYIYNNDLKNRFFPSTTKEGAIDANGLSGMAKKSSARSSKLLGDFLVTYNNKWNKHKLVTLAGVSAEKNRKELFDITAKGFATEDVSFNNLGMASSFTNPASSVISPSTLGYLARAEYSFGLKYNLTASMRYDGASVLPKDNRWGFFPSAGASWWLSEEGFVGNLKDKLGIKIRLGYGLTGNINGIAEGASLVKMDGVYTKYTFDGNNLITGLAPGNIANTDLQWEKTKQSNVGLDLILTNTPWSLSFDYYNKQTTNLIFNMPINQYYGHKTIIVSDGVVSNEGFEINLSGKIKLANHLSLEMNGNFSYNDNKVDVLPNENTMLLTGYNVGIGQGTIDYNRWMVGQPISTFYGYKADRIIQENDEQTLQPNSEPGDYLFKDLNEDGVIDEQDKTILGHGLPKYRAALNLNLSYKRWYLGAQFTGSFDVDRFNVNRAKNESRFWDTALDRWTPINTDTPIAKSGSWKTTQYGSFASDYFVEDASYVRLQNLTLGYDLNLNRSEFLKSCNISVTAQNLFTITNYSGFDPESSTGNTNTNLGLDQNGSPQSRNYLLTLNLKF
ncbi:TonB-dependent receptor [Labilibacter sediminis]|nr:TonB-dependent receptor [Labilibacter sediminis]